MSELDVLIKDASIVDGTGKKAYHGSIGVKDEKIVSIGKTTGEAKKVINAEGLTATPGFIDAHSHADWTLLWYPYSESYVMQGVTTFVGGQCGGSPAPLNEFIRPPRILAADYLDELSPHLFYPPEVFPIETVNSWMEEKVGWALTWRTVEEYFNVVSEKGISMNYVPLVGHGTIRYAVMGEDYKRESNDDELAQMKELVHHAMEQGCVGMSAGLDYDPDVFAGKEEIDECVSVLKEYNGVYSPHWRRTGRRRNIEAGARQPDRIAGIKEVIDTCRKTGVKLQIAHLFGGYEVNPSPPDVIQRAVGKATLKAIDKAREEGHQVTFDVIPYWEQDPMPYLCGLHFTPWLRLLGSREKLAEWLKVEEFREEVNEALAEGKWFVRVAYNPNLNPHWAENITVVQHTNSKYENKTVAEIAEEQSEDPMDMLMDLIVADPDAKGATPDYRGSDEYVKLFFQHPACMVGVDVAVYDNKRQQKRAPWRIPGINTYAAYPAFLNKNVKKEGTFTLEEAVRKCTTLPAQVYNLKNRGVLRPHYYADIVLFDFQELNVQGDVLEPRRYPAGIEYVMVNGTLVVKNGQHTHATPGTVVKSPA